MLNCTFFSLFVVAVGLFTAFSLLPISHILMIIPGLYYLKERWPLSQEKFFSSLKNNKSQMALMGLVMVGFLSVLFNWGDISRPLGKILKLKYFVISWLGIYSLQKLWDSNLLQKNNFQKLKLLLYTFLISTSVATMSGLIGLISGFNPLRMKSACHAARACGMYGMYMTYGYGILLFMVLSTGLLYYYYQKNSWLRNHLKLNPTLLWSSFIINFLGMIFSFTRGAIIGYVLTLPFFLLKNHKKRFYLTWLLYFILSIPSFFILNQTKTFNDLFFHPERITSNNIRLSQFKAAWKAFTESPVVGIGYRNLEPSMQKIKEKYQIEYPEFIGHAHNNFLEHLGSTGLLGFLLLLLFHVFWLKEMYQRDDLVAKITFPFIIAFFISGQFQYTFGDGENLFLIMTVYALSQVKEQQLLS